MIEVSSSSVVLGPKKSRPEIRLTLLRPVSLDNPPVFFGASATGMEQSQPITIGVVVLLMLTLPTIETKTDVLGNHGFPQSLILNLFALISRLFILCIAYSRRCNRSTSSGSSNA